MRLWNTLTPSLKEPRVKRARKTSTSMISRSFQKLPRDTRLDISWEAIFFISTIS